uniref:Uncharacterized protein n=1 Tax=Avena sativa TaxID=4498 RepID=A0ACD5UU88_AVESA
MMSATTGELKECNMAGQPRTAKRKAEEEAAAGEECAAKRKVETAASEGEQAAGEKKMSRLPEEEVERILAHVVDDRAPHYFESLKLKNPSLLPSTEEAADRSTVVLYSAARTHYAGGERMVRFQALVRAELEKRGYVEVEEEFLAHRAQVRAWSDAARARILKEFAASADSEDDD